MYPKLLPIFNPTSSSTTDSEMGYAFLYKKETSPFICVI